MTWRRLRIMFSAAFGMICLLLILLWIGSYGKNHRWFRVGEIGWQSENGVLWSAYPFDIIYDPTDVERYAVLSTYMMPASQPIPIDWNVDILGLRFFGPGSVWLLRVPCWLALLTTGGLAVASWMKWSYRFSLRTLLIGMTVAAAVLGTAVYMIRQ